MTTYARVLSIHVDTECSNSATHICAPKGYPFVWSFMYVILNYGMTRRFAFVLSMPCLWNDVFKYTVFMLIVQTAVLMVSKSVTVFNLFEQDIRNNTC